MNTRKFDPQNKFESSFKNVAKILSRYGIKEFSYKVFLDGIANVTLYVSTAERRYVLRVYTQQRKKDSDIHFELCFQKYLREAGIPIPVFYNNLSNEELTVVEIRGRRWQAVLMEFIEGHSKTQEHTPELISELATFQARMHVLGTQFKVSAPRPYSKWNVLVDVYAKDFTDTSSYSEKIQKFINRTKRFSCPLDLTLPYGYNHLDLDLDGNVIVKENKINGIVDFDDLAYSPIAVCLGYSLWNVLHDGNIEKMMSYLECYRKIRPLIQKELDIIPHIVLYRNHKIGMVRLMKTKKAECMERILAIEPDIQKLINQGIK